MFDASRAGNTTDKSVRTTVKKTVTSAVSLLRKREPCRLPPSASTNNGFSATAKAKPTIPAASPTIRASMRKCRRSWPLENPFVIRSPISLRRRLYDACETVLPTYQDKKNTGTEKTVNDILSARMVGARDSRGESTKSFEENS